MKAETSNGTTGSKAESDSITVNFQAAIDEAKTIVESVDQNSAF